MRTWYISIRPKASFLLNAILGFSLLMVLPWVGLIVVYFFLGGSTTLSSEMKLELLRIALCGSVYMAAVPLIRWQCNLRLTVEHLTTMLFGLLFFVFFYNTLILAGAEMTWVHLILYMGLPIGGAIPIVVAILKKK